MVFASNAGNGEPVSGRFAGLELAREEPFSRLLVLMESCDESLACRLDEPEPIPDELLGLLDVVLDGELRIALLPLEGEEWLDATGEWVIVVWEAGAGVVWDVAVVWEA